MTSPGNSPGNPPPASVSGHPVLAREMALFSEERSSFVSTCTSHDQATYCPISDWAFADGVADDIANALAAYKGGRMALKGYTPPYEPGEFPDGYLDMDFCAEGQPDAYIGLPFDRTDMYRSGFDAVGWKESGMDPSHSGIVTATFDEAWRIVCQVGMKLDVKEVAISYGC